MPDATLQSAMALISVVALAAVAYFDWRHRRILNWVVFPVTIFILVVTFWQDRGAFLPALSGAIVGFLIFLALFSFGRLAYGRGALGFGDVKLAMMIGAILGIGGVLPALALGILLAGLGALIWLISGRATRGDTLPYGAYLALAALMMLGAQLV